MREAHALPRIRTGFSCDCASRSAACRRPGARNAVVHLGRHGPAHEPVERPGKRFRLARDHARRRHESAPTSLSPPCPQDPFPSGKPGGAGSRARTSLLARIPCPCGKYRDELRKSQSLSRCALDCHGRSAAWRAFPYKGKRGRKTAHAGDRQWPAGDGVFSIARTPESRDYRSRPSGLRPLPPPGRLGRHLRIGHGSSPVIRAGSRR